MRSHDIDSIPIYQTLRRCWTSFRYFSVWCIFVGFLLSESSGKTLTLWSPFIHLEIKFNYHFLNCSFVSGVVLLNTFWWQNPRAVKYVREYFFSKISEWDEFMKSVWWYFKRISRATCYIIQTIYYGWFLSLYASTNRTCKNYKSQAKMQALPHRIAFI